MKAALIVLAIASYVLYANAIRRHFRREFGIQPRMRLLQLVGTVTAGVHIWQLATVHAPPLGRAVVAAMLFLGGLAVFVAARHAVRDTPLTLAFSPDMPQFLVARGIYRHVRHPFYLAYSLTWLAACVAVPGVLVGATTALMLGFYWNAARLEESKFMASSLSRQYENYRSMTGMFLPLHSARAFARREDV